MIHKMETLNKTPLWILEDDPNLLKQMAALAASQGFKATLLESVGAAWELLRGQPTPLIPCVISDFNLPDGTSEKWLRELRRQSPIARILCYSSCPKPMLDLLFYGEKIIVLEKPLQLEEVFKNF